ncbi:unnamed protein product [Pedinophyceae sp. YPF-701]|nr:unnamed protein product [Pedinophyceae sp. YPF-701]
MATLSGLPSAQQAGGTGETSTGLAPRNPVMVNSDTTSVAQESVVTSPIPEHENNLLFFSISCGDVNMARTLLQDGRVPWSVKDAHGWTPAHLACRFGNTEVLKMVMDLSQGKAAASQLPNGRTPLHVAAGLGHISNMRLLIAFGADVNLPDIDGLTPLHHAAVSDSYYAVDLLLMAQGINLKAEDKHGRTPAVAAPRGSASYQILAEAEAAAAAAEAKPADTGTAGDAKPGTVQTGENAAPRKGFLSRCFCGGAQ